MLGVTKKIVFFVGGTLFGSAGFDLLCSKDARKVYTHITAAALRCKDKVMRDVEAVQESCSDILADAKAINNARAAKDKAEFIEDKAKDAVKNSDQNVAVSADLNVGTDIEADAAASADLDGVKA